MAVKAASDRLLIKLTKTRSAPTSSATLEVRLVSGDVESTEPIAWTACSLVGWLWLNTTTGTVYSNVPVAPVGVVVDATGLSDTLLAGPLNTTIALTSTMPAAGSNDAVFERESSVLQMVVELTIVAEVELILSDVVVQTLDGGTLSTGASTATSNLDIVTVDAVAAGSKLVVTVKAFDYERLPISRPDLRIVATLVMGENRVWQGVTNLMFLSANEYRAEVPATWVQDAGSYDLNVSSSTSSVELRFSVSSSKQSVYIALGISSVKASLGVVASLGSGAFTRKHVGLMRLCMTSVGGP
jgi:hypothetical protein